MTRSINAAAPQTDDVATTGYAAHTLRNLAAIPEENCGVSHGFDYPPPVQTPRVHIPVHVEIAGVVAPAKLSSSIGDQNSTAIRQAIIKYTFEPRNL